MSSQTFDVAIIGGGIVGLATARALVANRSLSLVVLEAEDRLAAHQSGHNSGVIHSGLYYKPGSLKARNCVQGREEMYRFCRERGIPHERCGKIVVATCQSELPALEELERRGRANGLAGLRRLDPTELREHEPHVAGLAGLFVPDTGVVDFAQATREFARDVQKSGATICTQSRVLRCRRSNGDVLLDTTRGEFRCRFLINCAGLRADEVARMCGVHPGVRIVPFRGEYHELVPDRRFLVNHLIYPVPDPRFPFLGVHFTRTIRGDVEAGPNAILALKREGYRPWEFSLPEFGRLISYPGFWRLVWRYRRTGLGEIYRSLWKKAMVQALQRLIPELKAEDLRPGKTGVRAQAVDPAGNLVDDFRIVQAERMIHVLNAPSPAATASISIGKIVAGMVS
jgi:L-2-hydroxyglutarate oxidase